MAGGRENQYKIKVEPRLQDIIHWCRDGLTEEEICKRLDVGVSTFARYKNDNKELREALKSSKEVADYAVEDSLYKRALGYVYDEVTSEQVYNEKTEMYEMRVTKIVTKQVVPDTTAQIFWLKNRRPDKWRDKHDIEHSGEIEYVVELPDVMRSD